MTHDVIVLLAVLGVIGQVLFVVLLAIGLLALFGARGPLSQLRLGLEGSEIAHFIPCELCWYQRICMYPLSITTLLAALAADRRAARYLLPLPLVGAGVSVYHILVENQVVSEAQTCKISAPGGCALKWINEFGYMTIPTLALTGFALITAFLLLAAAPPATVEAA